jgi:hypothetical protein
MPNYLSPAQGHHELTEKVVFWDTDHALGRQVDVVLIASISDGPGGAIFAPQWGKTATTLAIRMDHQVAKQLLGTLIELGRTTGWLQEEEGQSQS